LRPDTAPDGEPSSVIVQGVTIARERQLARNGKPNARLGTREISKHCKPDPQGQQLLERAMEQLGLSARAYHRGAQGGSHHRGHRRQ
jgi:magnesium chelatase family protein